MPRGGRITIETANRWIDERGSQGRDLIPGQYLSLCVSDTGTGMSPEVINRVFDPFFTTKPLGQGTGLGLSMVYGFVRQSGGQVRIYSEPGQGTNMCLYLPRHYLGAPEEIEAADACGSAPAQTERTVMIVDDEPTIRMLVAEVLEDQGYIPIEAGEGASALKVLESDARIDLLVTDVGLPGGMNGRAIGRCCAHHSTRPQSAVHHRVRRERHHWQRPSGSGHVGAHQTLHHGSVCQPHLRNDRARRLIPAAVSGWAAPGIHLWTSLPRHCPCCHECSGLRPCRSVPLALQCV